MEGQIDPLSSSCWTLFFLRNLARIVRDAQLEPWKARMAAEFKCPVCESIKPGGISSGKVPPAATHAQFGPWQALGLDVAEWTIPGKTTKQKFLLMIDMATRLRMIYPLLDTYDITSIQIENAEMVIKAVTLEWLSTYPKPYIIVADNAKSFASVKFSDFCRDSGIELAFPAEKEAWAHGLVEHAIKDVKTTAIAPFSLTTSLRTPGFPWSLQPQLSTPPSMLAASVLINGLLAVTTPSVMRTEDWFLNLVNVQPLVQWWLRVNEPSKWQLPPDLSGSCPSLQTAKLDNLYGNFRSLTL